MREDKNDNCESNYLSISRSYRERIIVKAFENNNWIASVGPDIDEFEQVLAGYVKTEVAVALDSGACCST